MGCATTKIEKPTTMLIKEVTSIDVHYGKDGDTQVWITSKSKPGRQMIRAEYLDFLPEFIQAVEASTDNPGLQDAIDRVIMLYRLGKKND